MKTILVTGGAGYIGSHVLNQLSKNKKYNVIVVDNLSTGRKESVIYGDLKIGDVGDHKFMDSVFASHDISAVLHFAGSIVVPESVENPLKYYSNNTINSFKLLEHIAKYNNPPLIFSSTAAVYGELKNGIASEESPTNPESPYGRTKLMTEEMIKDLNISNPKFRYVILRYFNVAGASMDGNIGQSTPQATHLLKAACETAIGKRKSMSIFGIDYPTADGTCIRDFIHVDDLARAHVAAIDYLINGYVSQTLNCGYGAGHSVKEVIEMTKKVSAKNFSVEVAPRRPGDCMMVMSKAEKIKTVLNWIPQNNDLETIVKSALDWEAKLK
ncbi:MAG: UDP-glucose 4-epimerase GalE [Bacteriovoracaceae bacterium]|nr:UDP-glucose 4-epimerase GalE [Bacteriovoracaceae bacterium]